MVLLCFLYSFHSVKWVVIYSRLAAPIIPLGVMEEYRVLHTMGISGGSNLLYRSPNLDLRQLHRRRSGRTGGKASQPCMDGNAYQVGYTLHKLSPGPAMGTLFYIGRGIGISGVDIHFQSNTEITILLLQSDVCVRRKQSSSLKIALP